MLHLRSASLVGSFELSQVQVSLTRQALSRVQAQCQVTTRERSGLGLENLISEIVISDEIGGRSTWKPSPTPFLKVCERLDTKPTLAVYVGHNPHKDFLGARAAGLASVRLRLSAGLHVNCEPKREEDQADRTVREFREIPEAIDSLT
jgi:FMN phosphatase YigB (HAD superfamily)